eukprot:1532019-Rhodomonas_salina.3
MRGKLGRTLLRLDSHEQASLSIAQGARPTEYQEFATRSESASVYPRVWGSSRSGKKMHLVPWGILFIPRGMPELKAVERSRRFRENGSFFSARKTAVRNISKRKLFRTEIIDHAHQPGAYPTPGARVHVYPGTPG